MTDSLKELLTEYETQLQRLDNAHDKYLARMVAINQPVLKTSPLIVEFEEFRSDLVRKISLLKNTNALTE
jgi:hypothetical protein